MDLRYATRPDARGHSVIDLETGRPAELAMVPQVGLSLEDAEHTATQFNLRQALLSGSGRPGPSRQADPGLA
jgi:hypothetical protein